MLKSFILFSILLAIPFYSAYAEEVPEWIRNNAKWWSDGQIDDQTFVQGIEFLINKGIIPIKSTEISDNSLDKIPDWIKQNAKWWSDGQIDDQTFVQGLEFLVKSGIISVSIPTDEVIPFSGNSPLFDKFAYKKDFRNVNGQMVPIEVYFGLKPEMQEKYDEIGFFSEKSNAVVIQPIFTSSAYWEPGFYTYYRDECGVECLTKKIDFDKPLGFSGSEQGFKILKLLNYDTISDYELSKNPSILENYDKIIVLHNEYITKEMFDAIDNHSKVVYLYPNALYAEIDVDFIENSISLVRGHGYPESDIDNGFDWEFDNTRPYEYDTDCSDWEFYEIDNGIMLNCYPENIIFTDFELLKTIRDY